jgi:histidinol-phosphate aminotransferase
MKAALGRVQKCLAALQNAAVETWKYGDPENYDLKAVIARHHGVSPANIVVGKGIDGVLGVAARLMVSPGAVAVTTDGGYPTFNYHITANGGALVTVPYRHDREDLEGLLTAARRYEPALLFVSNPNSPMGTWWSATEIERFIAELPPGVLLLLDEAYSDTAAVDTFPPLALDNPQVLRFRTFSKAYGLAGARIGYALGEAGLIQEFNKIRNHYGVNRLA